MADILVIEDDPEVCRTLFNVLVHSGHRVEVAYDGDKGIELFKERGLFSMVITDIRMLRKDGNEVARYIRNSAEKKDTPVVAITGYLDDVERDLFNLVLEKPFKMADVIKIIDSFN